MKKLFALVLFLALGSAQAATLSGDNNTVFDLNRVTSQQAFKHQMGYQLIKLQTRVQRCVYDFAVQGGAIGSIPLRNAFGQPCVVPSTAIVRDVLIDVITPGTTSASGTMALTMQTAGDLKAALAAASYTGLVAGIPVGTAATAIKLTADRTVTGVIATGALTAGKWNVLIQYQTTD